MFKLPAFATNAIFIACLMIMIFFTLMREKFLKPNLNEVKSRNVQILLIIIAICNYVVSIICAGITT